MAPYEDAESSVVERIDLVDFKSDEVLAPGGMKDRPDTRHDPDLFAHEEKVHWKDRWGSVDYQAHAPDPTARQALHAGLATKNLEAIRVKPVERRCAGHSLTLSRTTTPW